MPGLRRDLRRAGDGRRAARTRSDRGRSNARADVRDQRARGRPVPVYGDGSQRREFLYVEDWVRAAIAVMERGEPGVIYNIGDGHELSNLELARRICAPGRRPDPIADRRS